MYKRQVIQSLLAQKGISEDKVDWDLVKAKVKESKKKDVSISLADISNSKSSTHKVADNNQKTQKSQKM